MLRMSTWEKVEQCCFYWGGTENVFEFYEDTEFEVMAVFYILFLNFAWEKSLYDLNPQHNSSCARCVMLTECLLAIKKKFA